MDIQESSAKFKLSTDNLQTAIKEWHAALSFVIEDVRAFNLLVTEKQGLFKRAAEIEDQFKKKERELREIEITQQNQDKQKREIAKERETLEIEKMMLHEKKVILDKKEQALKQKAERVSSIMSSIE